LFKQYNNILTILFIGGTHGDEKSGYLALKNFNFENYNDIVIITIPRVNIYGIENDNRRDINGNHLNRFYGNSDSIFLDDNSQKKIKFIESQVLKADYVIDFHEAKRGFRSIDKKGLGNTIITQNNIVQGKYIVSELNESIDKDKNFVLLTKKKPMKYSLRHFCNQNNIKYLLVEVSKSQQITDRESICKTIIVHSIKWIIDKMD
jgi:hypothetical protein